MNNLINHVHTLITKGNKNDINTINDLIDDIIKQLVLHKNININLFYPVFIILLDRLFGEDITIQYDSATGSTGYTPSLWVKGVIGGWLKALIETNLEPFIEVKTRKPSTSKNNSIATRNDQYRLKASYIDTVTSSTQRLIQYFIPNTSPLLDLLNKSQSRFELKITMLPNKLYMYLIDHPATIAFNCSNLDQLCHHLLMYPLHATLQVYM